MTVDWNNYFMEIAKATSLRSKDPNYKVGCILVSKSGKIVGTGYNGMPKHPTKNNDELIDWDKRPKLKIIHAEMNAILNSRVNESDLPLTAYTTDESCIDCLKHLIQFGVVKIYYLNTVPEKYESEDRREMLEDYSDILENIKLEM